MTLSLRPPDTSTADFVAPPEPTPDGLLLTIAIAAFLLSLAVASRRPRPT